MDTSTLPMQAYKLYIEDKITGDAIAQKLSQNRRNVYRWIAKKGIVQQRGRPRFMTTEELFRLKNLIETRQSEGKSLNKNELLVEVINRKFHSHYY